MILYLLCILHKINIFNGYVKNGNISNKALNLALMGWKPIFLRIMVVLSNFVKKKTFYPLSQILPSLQLVYCRKP